MSYTGTRLKLIANATSNASQQMPVLSNSLAIDFNISLGVWTSTCSTHVPTLRPLAQRSEGAATDNKFGNPHNQQVQLFIFTYVQLLSNALLLSKQRSINRSGFIPIATAHILDHDSTSLGACSKRSLSLVLSFPNTPL